MIGNGFKHILVLALVLSTIGRQCSNDTRTGLPYCNLCSSLRECWTAGDMFSCTPNLQLNAIMPDDNSGHWIGSCFESDQDLNLTDIYQVNIPNDNITLGSIIINASASTGCTKCLMGEFCNGDTIYCDIGEINNFSCNAIEPCYCTLREGKVVDLMEVSGTWVEAKPVQVCYGNLYQGSEALFKNADIPEDSKTYDWDGRRDYILGKKRIEKLIEEKSKDGNIDFSAGSQFKGNFLARFAEYMGIQVMHEMEPKRMNKITKRGILANGISVTWDQDTKTIGVVTNKPGETRIMIEKGTLSDNYPCDLKSNDFVIDDKYLTSTEGILWRLYVNSSLVDSGIFATRKSVPCNVPECVFCHDVVVSWVCFTPAFKTMTIFFYVFFGAIIICLLIIAFFVLRGVTNNFQVSFKGLPAQTTQALVMSLMILGGSACEQSFSVSSTGFTCVNNGIVRTCQLSETVLTTIPAPGYTICYDLVDTQYHNTITGRIAVTYNEMKSYVGLNLNYYTSAFDVQSVSVLNCGGGPNCITGNDCNNNRTGDDYKYQGNALISTPLLELPGRRGCIDTSGGWDKGCALLVDACIYWGWGIKPRGTVFRVSTPTSLIKKPSITICFSNYDGETKCNDVIIASSAIVHVTTDLDLQYQGSLVGSTSLFAANKFIMAMDGSASYYGPGAANGANKAGSVGDLQGATEGAFNNPTFTSFAFDWGIAQADSSGERSAIIHAHNPGTDLLTQYPKFPTQIGNVIWYQDGNSGFEGVDQAPGALLMAINVKNKTFVREIDQVCPVMTSQGIRGSFQSSGGATWSVIAYSECKQGPCLLTTDNDQIILTRSSLNLAENKGYYYAVNFTSNVKEGTVTLTCDASGNKASVTESFSLDDPVVIINDGNGTIIPGQTTDGGSPTGFTLGQWVGFSFAIGAGLIVIIITIVVLVMFCKVPINFTKNDMMFELPKYDNWSGRKQDENVGMLSESEVEIY